MKPIQTFLILLSATLFTLLAAPAALAASIYWNGTGTPWSSVASWSTASGATTPNPSAVPGASDTAIYNITTVNSAQTCYLNGNELAQVLTFNNTGTTTLKGGISGTPANNVLTLGNSGAANTALTTGTGAGAVTIGDATANVTLTLAGAHDYTFNLAASTTVTLPNGVNFNGGRIVQNTGSGTLVLNGAATGSGTITSIGGVSYLSTARLSGGTAVLGVPGALGTSSEYVDIRTGGTLQCNTPLTGANKIPVNFDIATGTATIGGANNIELGGTLICSSAGTSPTLAINNTGSTTLSGTVALSDVVGTAKGLAITGTGSATISGVIQNFTTAGSGAASGLTYGGTGTLTLSGNNGYTGGTTVSSGIINAQNNNAFGTSGTVTCATRSSGIQLQGGVSIPSGVAFKLSNDGLVVNGATVFYALDNVSGTNAVSGPVSITSGGGAAAIQSDSGALTLAGNISIASGLASRGVYLQGASTGTNTLSGVLSDFSGTSLFSIIKYGAGTWAVSGANTFSGGTIVSNGTFLVNNTSGSGTGSGTVLVTGSGSVLGGSGTISGVTTISGSAALTPRPAGGSATTLTFGSNLTLTNASANFTLSGTAGGSNDKVAGVSQLTVDSTVTFNITNTGGLDQSTDYALISSSSLNSGGGGTPVLYVNGVLSDQTSVGNYKLLVTAAGVALHYIAATAPVINSATFSPNPQYHNGSSTLTVLVTPTSGNTISSISVTSDSLGGGGDPANLSRTDANGPGLQETWVGTFNVPSSLASGSYVVAGTVTQSDSFTAPYSASLTVATNTYVWNGNATPGNSDWSAGNNWAGGLSPGTGDNVDFSGNNGLSPNMDQAFSLASLMFDSLATATFTIGGSSPLTISGSNAIVNNSSSAQIVNVPISLGGASTISAASGDLTLGGNISGGGGLTKTGNGTLTLSGTDSYAGTTTISAGQTAVNNSGSINNAAAMSVGSAAGNTAILQVGGNITVNTLAIGGGGDTTDMGGGSGAGAGAVYQTNGTVTLLSGGITDSIFILGGSGNQGAAGYGYYNLSGGTLSGNVINVGGRVNQGLGLMDVLTGGTVQPAGTLPIGRGNAAGQPGYGVLNVVGGAVSFTGAVNPNPGDAQLMLGYRGGLSELNISAGGSVTLSPTGALANGSGADLMRLAGGSTSVVNLNANSTLTVPLIFATTPVSGTNNSLLNFNGGTLKATSVNAGSGFLSSTNIGAVTIYSGGATVDNSGTAVTISNALIAASGDGVQTIVVSSGGSNYIGAPLVQITGGTANGGAVATAVANMVDDGSGKTFKVGTITVTSPGSYSADPTGVSIIGNGTALAAVAGIGTIAANTSGGLTAAGSGTLTLAGANTYTGNTTVNAGTLELVSPALATNSTVTIASGAVLQLDAPVTNTVADLVLNGASQPVGVYNSTTSPFYIAGSGSLLVGTLVATNPTNIITTVIGGNLVLSWPADHIGWHLQAQTNSLIQGLGTNWVDVPGTSTANSFTNSIDPANGAVFYRLTYP